MKIIKMKIFLILLFINIKTINKIGLFEITAYILKNHLLQYKKDKEEYFTKQETLKKSKNIVDETMNNVHL